MSNPIGWCDTTVNGIVGCRFGCTWCYARRQAKRFKHRCQKCYDFEPHEHLERLQKISSWRVPKRIFMSSMCDWFGPGVDHKWVEKIVGVMRANPQHVYQILTKNPIGYGGHDWPQTCWLGTTVTCEDDTRRIQTLWENTPSVNVRFVSVEPLLGPISPDVFTKERIDWVIIGAETGNAKTKTVPKFEWVEAIHQRCKAHRIPIYIKDSIPIVNRAMWAKEFPR